jgi:hypothetical protein
VPRVSCTVHSEQTRSRFAYAWNGARVAATSTTALSLGQAERSSHRCRHTRCPNSSGARARDRLISHSLASGFDKSETEIVASAMLAVRRRCVMHLHPTMTHVSEHGGPRRTAPSFQLRGLRGDRRRASEPSLGEPGDAVAEDEHVEGCHGATLSHERRRNRRGWRPRAAPWNAKMPASRRSFPVVGR